MRPNRPQKALGTRIEPLVSEPRDNGHEAARDRRARAARRAARHALEIVRIARRAVVRVLAGEVIGVFAHVERAEEDGAGALRAARRASRPSRRAARSRLIFEPARVGRPSMSNRFLTANGTPASGPRLSPRARAASIASALRERPRRGHVGEGAERAVSRLDPLERRLGDFARARPRRS